jgi:hypothetical protein
MKHSLKLASLLFLAAAFISSCEQDPTSIGSSDLSLGGKPVAANPALVWVGAQLIGGVAYPALYVGDSTISPTARIHTVSSTSVHLMGAPTWSPSGGSVVFSQVGSGSIPDSIKAIDISVNTKGNVVSSNLRTIVAQTSTSSRVKNSFWSSTAGANKIAYTQDDGASNSLWIVSASGGSPTQVASIDETWAGSTSGLGYPTWNADDSRLAVVRHGNNSAMIMIYNTSTWEYVDSIAVDGTIFGLEWSRAGANKLAFGLQAVGGTTNKLYFVTPTTGSTPTTNNVLGSYPTWSPNNSSVLYFNSQNAYKNVPGTTSTTLISNFGGLGMKWKR